MKKRTFLLVELIVSLTLFSTVLAALFGLYIYYSRTNEALSSSRKKSEEIRIAHNKLKSLFCIFDETGISKDDTFYTVEGESPRELGMSVVFSYKNDGDRDRYFAASCLAKLYFDAGEKMLALAVFPDPKKFPPDESKNIPMRVIPILDKVETVEFSFWLAPSMANKLEGTTFPNDGNKDTLIEWKKKWERKSGVLPTLMRIKIQQTNVKEPLLFSFVVSSNIGALDL